jgi:hypothetical protein
MPCPTFNINKLKSVLFIRNFTVVSTITPREEILRKKKDLNGMSVLTFPKKDQSAHSMLLIFKKYKYQSPGDRRINSIASTKFSVEEISGNALLLPLPREISDSFRVNIGEFSQGVFGDAISQGSSYMLNGGAAPTREGLIENAGLPSTSSVVGLGSAALFSTLAFLTKNSVGGGGALGALLPSNETIANSLEAGAGATVNPKQALQFKGIELKTHNFSWTFAPRSVDESDEILKITQLVKRNALPSYGTLGPVRRAILSYPSTVDIYFFGLQEEYFTRYKTCMIENFNFNYTPQGMAIMRGGKPAVVNMSMTLKEMDIHTAEDYDGSSRSFESFGDLDGLTGLLSGTAGLIGGNR